MQAIMLCSYFFEQKFNFNNYHLKMKQFFTFQILIRLNYAHLQVHFDFFNENKIDVSYGTVIVPKCYGIFQTVTDSVRHRSYVQISNKRKYGWV